MLFYISDIFIAILTSFSSQFCRLCDLDLHNKQVANKANAIIPEPALLRILYLKCSHLLLCLLGAEKNRSDEIFTSAPLGI